MSANRDFMELQNVLAALDAVRATDPGDVDGIWVMEQRRDQLLRELKKAAPDTKPGGSHE